MDKDLDQAKGRIKQAAGDLTDNDDLKREGKADETGGKVKEAVTKADAETLKKTLEAAGAKVELK